LTGSDRLRRSLTISKTTTEERDVFALVHETRTSAVA
jgi:hypothetical protein